MHIANRTPGTIHRFKRNLLLYVILPLSSLATYPADCNLLYLNTLNEPYGLFKISVQSNVGVVDLQVHRLHFPEVCHPPCVFKTNRDINSVKSTTINICNVCNHSFLQTLHLHLHLNLPERKDPSTSYLQLH